jgi:hypothetical protein
VIDDRRHVKLVEAGFLLDRLLAPVLRRGAQPLVAASGAGRLKSRFSPDAAPRAQSTREAPASPAFTIARSTPASVA